MNNVMFKSQSKMITVVIISSRTVIDSNITEDNSDLQWDNSETVVYIIQ